MNVIKLALTGACGRMGRRILALARESARFEVVGAIVRPDHPLMGSDAGEVAGVGKMGVPLTFDLKPTPDVLVDFSAAPCMRHWLKVCRDREIPMVIGTTGLHAVDHAAIEVASENVPIVQATNMSLGVTLLNKLVEQAAKVLGDDYDIEVVESHHRLKKDAPSGTAKTLIETLLKATGKDLSNVIYGRMGDDAQRVRGQIGVHAVRMGDEIGKHTVYMAATGERLELTHVATQRDTFAHGALRAAKWVVGQKPGRFTMGDVLGL